MVIFKKQAYTFYVVAQNHGDRTALHLKSALQFGLLKEAGQARGATHPLGCNAPLTF